MIEVLALPDDRSAAWRVAAERRLLERRLAAGTHPEAARRTVANLLDRAGELDSRAWLVRRDGTEVGTAWTFAAPEGASALLDLDVPVGDAPAARQGLEATLRSAGATNLSVDVLTGDAVLAAAMTDVDVPLEATQMQLTLTGPGAGPLTLPARVRLVPMTAEHYAGYLAHLNASYAQELFAAGTFPDLASATRASEQSLVDLLPDGVDTAGHHLWSAYDGDTAVAILWIRAGGPTAYIYDIEVHADQRRRGYGREVLGAAAVAARDLGADAIGLNVFGPNDGARALYERAGYLTTERSFRIRL